MEADVFDLDIAIARFIGDMLKKYVEENKKAAFPTCGSGAAKDRDNGLTEEKFREKVRAWNSRLETLASKFDKLAQGYDHSEQKDIDEAFDELKQVFAKLWI